MVVDTRRGAVQDLEEVAEMRAAKFRTDARAISKRQHAAHPPHNILENRQPAHATTGLAQFHEIADVIANQRHRKIVPIADDHTAGFSGRAGLAFRVEKLDFAVGPPSQYTGMALAVIGNHDYLMGADDLDYILQEVDTSFQLLGANFHTSPKYLYIHEKIHS